MLAHYSGFMNPLVDADHESIDDFVCADYELIDSDTEKLFIDSLVVWRLVA